MKMMTTLINIIALSLHSYLFNTSVSLVHVPMVFIWFMLTLIVEALYPHQYTVTGLHIRHL